MTTNSLSSAADTSVKERMSPTTIYWNEDPDWYIVIRVSHANERSGRPLSKQAYLYIRLLAPYNNYSPTAKVSSNQGYSLAPVTPSKVTTRVAERMKDMSRIYHKEHDGANLPQKYQDARFSDESAGTTTRRLSITMTRESNCLGGIPCTRTHSLCGMYIGFTPW